MPFSGNTFEYTSGTVPGPANAVISSSKTIQRDADILAALNTTTSVARGGTGATTVITAHDALVTAGSDIASSGTINLTTATGASVDITGTTTITAVTLAAGSQRIARAVGAFQLTAGSSLIVNGSASVNYTTTAGDLLSFVGYGSSVVRVWVAKNVSAQLYSPQGDRSTIRYYSATQVQIAAEKNFIMSGFRYQGKYLNGPSKSFPAPALTDDARHIISIGNGSSTAGDLGAENWSSVHSWYAVFACANDGDAASTFKVMPFLRVSSIAGSVVTLNNAGENQRSVATKTYQFPTNELAGADCLVINETLNSRANAFSGRITTISANTGTTVTLGDVGNMAVYDYFLPAPQGYDNYRYLGTFYRDSSEIRNIADTGSLVGSRGSNNTQGSISGALGGAIEMPCDGHISPLATGVKFTHTDTVASSTIGDGLITYGMDNGGHDTDTFYYRKDVAGSAAFVFNFGGVPFSFHPKVWFYTGGALNIAANTRAMGIRGWIEP